MISSKNISQSKQTFQNEIPQKEAQDILRHKITIGYLGFSMIMLSFVGMWISFILYAFDKIKNIDFVKNFFITMILGCIISAIGVCLFI